MTGPECPDCAEMDSDADTPPPDFTATTLTGIIDDEEDPEGAAKERLDRERDDPRDDAGQTDWTKIDWSGGASEVNWSM